MDWDEESEEEREIEAAPPDSGPLLFRLTTIAIMIPALAILVLTAWSYAEDHHFSNKEIRLVCMILWASTMVILAIASIGGRHGMTSGRRRSRSPLVYVPLEEAKTPLAKWTQRESRRMLLIVFLAVLGVPGISFLLLLGYAEVTGLVLNTRTMKMVIPALWGLGILSGLFLAFRSTRSKLLYAQPKRNLASVPNEEEKDPENF